MDKIGRKGIKNLIVKIGGQWFFIDETMNTVGPYKSKRVAKKRLKIYATYLS